MFRTKAVLPLLIAGTLLVSGCNSGASTTSAPAASSAAVAPTTAAAQPGDAASTGAGTATDAASDCPTSNTTTLAKTKFAAHGALAFGAFHRYLYKPYRAGSFAKGANGRTVAFVKAGAAALFIKRELRLMSEDAKANPTLCKAVSAPLAALSGTVSGAVEALKSGDTSGILAAEKAVTGIEDAAKRSGNTIVEDPNPKIG